MNRLPLITDITDLAGKRVLVRVDMNVPLGNDGVVDDHEAWRIEKALPTLKYLSEAGARVIVISHIGRDPDESLRPVADYLKKYLDMVFIPQLVSSETINHVEHMNNGDIVMLENLRSNEGEITNDAGFVQSLGDMADVYVNDAFSVSHRAHASIVGVPRIIPSYTGFQFHDEVVHLSKMLNPKHPLLVIMAGAKFKTKLDVLKKFTTIADDIYIAGALAHALYHARGDEIGISFFDDEAPVDIFLDNPKIHVPEEVLVVDEGAIDERTLDQMTMRAQIVDMGNESLPLLASLIQQAQTILWNGPMGLYEDGYSAGTEAVARMIADAPAFCVVGGGDTVTAIREHNLEDAFGFISTAGGAMMEFLSEGTLVGITALASHH